MRNGFKQNASLAPEDPATAAAIEHANGVAQILRQNVVQGKHVGDDKYSEFRLTHVAGQQLKDVNRITDTRADRARRQ